MWMRYRIVNEGVFTRLLGGEAPFPSDEEVIEAGFDPADEELVCSELALPFGPHPAGVRVLHGLVLVGHPLAIEVK